MVYKEYIEYKYKYYQAQRKLDNLLDEKEKLFNKTQPHTTDISSERIKGGSNNNKFDNYVIEKERKKIDEKLRERKKTLIYREKLFRQKEQELLESKDIYDLIYRYRYIESYKVSKIARIIHYSTRQTSRYLSDIESEIKKLKE